MQDTITQAEKLVIIALWIAGLFILNFILRNAWTVLGRHFGVWHPKHDYYWPRLPWRPLWRVIAWLNNWWERSFGMRAGPTAGWTGVLCSMCLMYRPGSLLIGRARSWFGATVQPMGLSGLKRHLMMVAETGAGKTTFLITLLSCLKRLQSAFVIDPKGQITMALAGALRAQGRKVHVVDYLDITGETSACFNPLDVIEDLKRDTGQDYTALILEKIAAADVRSSGREDPFWPLTARDLWVSVLGQALTHPDPEKRNLVYARDLLMRGVHEHSDDQEEAMAILWALMEKNEKLGRIIPKGAALMAGEPSKMTDSILATVRANTSYLDLPQVRARMQRSTFSLLDLKGGSDVVFAVAPATEIRGALQPVMRQLTMLGLYVHEMTPTMAAKHPTMFCVDELPSLGHMQDVKTAIPLLRGFKVSFLGITQSIEQMREIYPKSWNGFFGGADAVFYMALNNQDSAQYLSKQLGIQTRTIKERGYRDGQSRKTKQTSELMTPDQVIRFLSEDRMIVTRFGKRPIKAQTLPYYNTLPVTAYEADPSHGDRGGRSWTRKTVKDMSAWRAARRRMSEPEARALYGLHESFYSSELDSREDLLAQTFPPAILKAARRTLLPLAMRER